MIIDLFGVRVGIDVDLSDGGAIVGSNDNGADVGSTVSIGGENMAVGSGDVSACVSVDDGSIVVIGACDGGIVIDGPSSLVGMAVGKFVGLSVAMNGDSVSLA